MSLLVPAGSNYIGVRDLASAVAWYQDKLGLRKIDFELDEPEGCVPLGFDKDECAVVLGPAGRPTDESAPLFYTRKLAKAREWLISRGVQVAAVQEDRQGTHFFEAQDLEGNTLEISEEP